MLEMNETKQVTSCLNIMKSLKFTVFFTTLFLVAYVSITQISAHFPTVFLFFLLSQGLLLYMVYRILKDKYSTAKTFEDGYEDAPLKSKPF